MAIAPFRRLGFFSCLAFAAFLIACGGGGGGSPIAPTPPAPNDANQWMWVRGVEVDVQVPPGWPGPSPEPWNDGAWYGTLGVPVAYNGMGAGTVPGGRYSSAYWTDKRGNFWLFGGHGLGGNEIGGYEEDCFLNDLWEFTPSNNEWTWVGGSDTGGPNLDPAYVVHGWSGVYGTQGTAASGNIPGGRMGAVSLTDHSGNFWLFGGIGFDTGTEATYLNDLWEFDTSTNEWTWVSGSSSGGQTGVYGTQGTPASANVPPGLQEATGWVDSNNNLWLFGGVGPSEDGARVWFNNLWEFNTTTREWTWVSGGGSAGVNGSLGAGVYGTLGVPSPNNIPGARYGSSGWIDSSGNLWVFGGFANGPVSPGGQIGTNELNDLWEFSPATEQWTWVAGEAGGTYVDAVDMAPALATYGTQGVAAPGNTPGGRQNATTWTDSAGTFWLFGGTGDDSTGFVGNGPLNDLWKFDLSKKEWTWVAGSDLGSQAGTYGTEGAFAAANSPGGRYSSAQWIDQSGDFWIFAGSGPDEFVAQSGPLNDLWRYHP